MPGSMNSPEANDKYLKRLLDERSSRADPFGHYSGYSENYDTPSVYSGDLFSPRLSDKSHPNNNSNFNSNSLPNDYPFKSPTLQHTSRRLLDDPSTSILDLDDDTRSSMALSDPYHHYNHDTISPDNDNDDDSIPRMSYLGPKMRFHSRAPWELEAESLHEFDETEPTSQTSIVSLLTGGRAKSSLKSTSSSPRISNVSRPSVESSISQINHKRSFETTSSHISYPRGALYALAQESLSTSSLTRPPHTGRQDTLRGKFSLSKLRTHSPTVSTLSSSDPFASQHPLNKSSSDTPPSPRSSYDKTPAALESGSNSRFPGRRRSASYTDGSVHPYANPDLVISYATEPSPQSPPGSPSPYSSVRRHDSNVTVTESPSSSLPVSPMDKPTLDPEMPAGLPKQRNSHFQGRDISSPVNLYKPHSCTESAGQQEDVHQELMPPIPLGPNSIPRWGDRAINPGFSLISLEEARAQRSRAMTTIQPPPPSLHSASSGESSVTTAFHNTSQETSTTLASAFPDSTYSHNTSARSRTRSVSAGAKAKSALQSWVGQPKPERRDSEPALAIGQPPGKDVHGAGTKTLKHKKSGFMRLFGNGAKGNEKDESASIPPVPPVPPLPEGHASQRGNKLSPHRIPVPSLSPSLLEALHENKLSNSSTEASQVPVRPPPSLKRAPPPLSINTGSPTNTNRVDPPARSSSLPDKAGIAQSAPPHTVDFPALKLRPVSTLFSAHFADHIVVSAFDGDEENSGPKDNGLQQRQSSLASGSASSGPSSGSVASFAESKSVLSPVTSSYMSTAGTALTTPTSSGFMSPVTPGSWSYGTRFSTEQQLVISPSSTNSTTISTACNGTTPSTRDPDTMIMVKSLQEHFDSSKKRWQKQVWELENQVHDLKAEVAELRSQSATESDGPYCVACGRGGGSDDNVGHSNYSQRKENGVLNRPRTRTGGGSRFVNT